MAERTLFTLQVGAGGPFDGSLSARALEVSPKVKQLKGTGAMRFTEGAYIEVPPPEKSASFEEFSVTAELVAAAASATNFALACVIEEGIDSDRSTAAIDAATVVVCDAIRSVHENCHQVHGAIGFTIEYGLHHHTLDLLRWRDDLEASTGGPMRCAERLGAAVVAEGGLWLAVTDLQRLEPRTP